MADADWLVLDGNLPAATLAHALRLADEAGVPVVLDPVSAPKAALIAPYLDGVPVHTLTPTADELVALTGDDVPASAAATLHARGVEVVWLREGVRGSTLFRPDVAPRTGCPPGRRRGRRDRRRRRDAGGVRPRLVPWRRPHAGRVRARAAAMLTVQSAETVRPDLSPALIDAALEALA